MADELLPRATPPGREVAAIVAAKADLALSISAMNRREREQQLILEAVDNWFEALERHGFDLVKSEIPKLRQDI